MKYKINMMRVAVLSVGIIGAMTMGAMLLKEEVTVETIDVNKPKISQEDIAINQSEVTIKSFKQGVDNIEWLDEENIAFDGEVESYGYGQYGFNITRNLLEKYDDIREDTDLILPEDAKDYIFIDKVANNRILLTDANPDDDIYALHVMNSEGGYRTLTENCMVDGKAMYIYSENKDKIAYYDVSSKKIKTYGVKSKRIRDIKEQFPETIVNNFHKTVKISENGGYLMVVYDPVLYGELVEYKAEDIYFSIYGADSGRVYGDQIFGINPSWSKDESKVAYLYAPEAQIVSYGPLDERTVVSKRVGILKFSSKDFTYIDSPLNSKLAINELMWTNTDNNLIYMAGEINDDQTLVIDSIMNYNYLKKMFVNNESTISQTLDDGVQYRLYVVDQYIGVVKKDGDQVTFNLFDEYSNFIAEDKKLQTFAVGYNAEHTYYYNDGINFMTFDGQKLLIRTDAKENYVEIDPNQAFRVFPSVFGNAICIEYYEDNVLKIVHY